MRRPAYGRALLSSNLLRGGILRVELCDQLLDALDLEQSLVMLVLSSAGVCSPALGCLAVAEIQHELLLRDAVSS